MLLLRIPIPTPFPVGPVNAYLLGPAPLTLFDCGPRTEEAWEALGAGLAAAGFRVEDVERLVLSHPHQDHAGLARRVREASGCPVYAHPADHDRLRDLPGVWARISGFLVEATRRAGAPDAVLGELGAALARLPAYTEPLDAVEPLGEGNTLEAGGRRLFVLHTPGHARGALCLWEPEQRTLLSGDTLLPRISSNAILEPAVGAFRERTLLSYRDTLARVAGLAPAAVFPGHGEPLGDPRDLIGRRLALHDTRAAQIRRLVAEGRTRPWQIAERLFPGLAAAQASLAVSEVVGHLDLLAERGEVVFEGQDGEWWAGPPPAGLPEN
jgi:glyoxylase-like metal-dependent hydrolase (beta-lactamase superfamily II)